MLMWKGMFGAGRSLMRFPNRTVYRICLEDFQQKSIVLTSLSLRKKASLASEWRSASTLQTLSSHHQRGVAWFADVHTRMMRCSPAAGGRDLASYAPIDKTLTAVTVAAESMGRAVKVKWEDESQSQYHSIWLRHNCQCPACEQAFSGQKIFPRDHVNPTQTVTDVSVNQESGLLQMTTAEEPGHVTIVKLDWLRENDYSLDSLQSYQEESCPSIFQGPGFPEVEYEEIMRSKNGLLKWVDQISDYGLSIVRNTPCEDGLVKKVAEMICPVQQTIYGETFDVVSTPKPINAAYSSDFLDYHMDLVYYESPPGLQFLHCLKFDSCVEGGDSLLLDLFHVLEELRQKHPADFDILRRIPATFQKIHYDRERAVCMRYRRPHIVTNALGQITCATWAPPFEGPLFAHEDDVEKYYKAYHRLAVMIRNSEKQIEVRLKPGDLLSFNNRRILHARQGFTLNGGMRHLQGCYLNIDEFKSEVAVLRKKQGVRRVVRNVLNQDYF